MSSDDFHALKIFISSPVNTEMIHALVKCTLKVLPSSQLLQVLPSPPVSPSSSRRRQLPSLFTFISRLVKYTNVFTGTLMATLVYLKKLSEKLPPNASAQDETSRHRIFLSCLILSAKFHNDASPKNMHWAKYTDGIFSTYEINQMERQLLYLLDWDISISNYDLYYVLHNFLVPIKTELKNLQKYKLFLKKQHQLQIQSTNSSNPFPKSKSLPYLTSNNQRSNNIHSHNKYNNHCPASAPSNTTEFPRIQAPPAFAIRKCPSSSQIKLSSNTSSYKKKSVPYILTNSHNAPMVPAPTVSYINSNTQLNSAMAPAPSITRKASASSSCYSDELSNPVSATSTTFGFGSSTSSNSSNSSSVIASPAVLTSEYPLMKLNIIDNNYYLNDYTGVVATEKENLVNSYIPQNSVMNLKNPSYIFEGQTY